MYHRLPVSLQEFSLPRVAVTGDAVRDVRVGVTAPVVQQLKGDVQRGGQQAADEAPRVEPGSSVRTVQVPHEKHEQVLHDEQDVEDEVPVPGRANGQE